MTPRRQRMLAVGLVVVGISITTALTVIAFRDSMMFYIELSDVTAGNVPSERDFRVGGLVTPGSAQRTPGDLTVTFTLHDMQHNLDVRHTGILPDLFREGQGIVAHGRLDETGMFVAHTVLAKHDENYMPPEVADTLAEQGYRLEQTPLRIWINSKGEDYVEARQ
ncbi:MAG: cytochrome c biogenesis protein CcmE [Gammaproteobacteria bacterium]|nr:MAG: cytochrome c biogenesis protein CcmE [Gammaproteobacteria bacterium]